MLKEKESEGKMAEEIEFQDWADDVKKVFENLIQKGKHYEERIEHLEQLMNSLRISMNRMLEHLDITIKD